jgi:hypothetical protein
MIPRPRGLELIRFSERARAGALANTNEFLRLLLTPLRTKSDDEELSSGPDDWLDRTGVEVVKFRDERCVAKWLRRDLLGLCP